MERGPEQDELKDKVTAAALRFVQQNALVVAPQQMLPTLDKKFGRDGFKLVLIDDGEDDGIPVFRLVPDSHRQGHLCEHLRSAFRKAILAFALSAVGAVLVVATGFLEMTGLAFFFLAYWAMEVVSRERQLRQARHVQAEMVKEGF